MSGMLKTYRRFARHVSWVIAIMLFIAISPITLSADQSANAHELLVNKYRQLEKNFRKDPASLPIYIESSVNDDFSGADLYGIIDYPFDKLRKELSSLSNWCDIVLLHSNVRACTFSQKDDNSILTLYNVNRHFHPISEAYQLFFAYHLKFSTPAYMEVVMTAEDGPFGSHDHNFIIKAIPLSSGKTLVELSYSYHYSSIQYLAMKSHFALSAEKPGFTVTGKDENNNPVYVTGVKGAIERTVMRYYLAILAYFDSSRFPAAQRYEKRINIWFELTARYKKQFPEMEKPEYITYKKTDLRNQILLQTGHADQVK